MQMMLLRPPTPVSRAIEAQLNKRCVLSVAASDFTNFAVTIAADRDLSIAV